MSDPTKSATDERYFTLTVDEKEWLREGERLKQQALSPYACGFDKALRVYNTNYPAYESDPDFYLLRSPFMVDVDKILHNPFYNRCTDKTQVFPFFRNDDITRRALHLQLVSHIARTIGHALRLNCDLIEAIALGHDMGHTPFGHAGEKLLDELSVEFDGGRRFLHNVHSVRVLKHLLRCNLTLPTFDGILSHCGERDFEKKYEPGECDDFATFERVLEECVTVPERDACLRPGTLEGCVVRISDMLAYIGKDRQDAVRAGLFKRLDYETDGVLGVNNLQILDRAVTNLVKNSMDCPYLKLDKEVATDLNRLRAENTETIYLSLEVRDATNNATLGRMMRNIFESCLEALAADDPHHPIRTHHLSFVVGRNKKGIVRLSNVYEDEANKLGVGMDALYPRMAIDYIASMTDDYFVDVHRHLFPESPLSAAVRYTGYFD